MAFVGEAVEKNKPEVQAEKKQNYTAPFALMTSLFFTWGFLTVFNDVLIPHFKEAFTLNYFQAMLVQFAWYGAYFLSSLTYFLISVFAGDPIAKIGYKNGVAMALLIAACGAATFYPAAEMKSYPLFLMALFIVGIGFAMLQIAANPYVTILGPERTASSRLNLAQGFNSVGTTLGPLIGGYLIFEYFRRSGVTGVDAVKIPYLTFSVIFVLMAIVFFFVHLPHVGEGKIERGAGALKIPYVVLGMVGIFMYVGGEIAVASSIINFLGQPTVAGLSKVAASKYVSLFWGGMLIGRFMGAVELSEMKPRNKQIFLAGIPAVAYVILGLVSGWSIVQYYLVLLFITWLLFQFGKANPARLLTLISAAAVVLLFVTVVVGGQIAIWCVVGVGLFSSISWSNIFSLALEGTGVLKSQVSSLLVMSIFGGALVPPLQGHVADLFGLQFSYIVPLVAYIYLIFYGIKGYKIGRKIKTA